MCQIVSAASHCIFGWRGRRTGDRQPFIGEKGVGTVKSIFLVLLSLFGFCFLNACGGGVSPAPPASPTPFFIDSTAPPNGVINVPFDFQFTAANGLQPFTWMETGGLPAGLVFSPGGHLSGVPTASGSFPITVSVKDSLGHSSATPVEIFQIFTRGFQATGDMGTARTSHTATLLTNGKVLVAGGTNNVVNLGTAELFDPAAGTFTATGAMTEPRSQHTATLLTNGKVLLAGGTNDNSAELFDPATGTFTATGPMTEPRSQHTATLLTNGKVLLAGGTADNSAELFDPTTGSFAATGGMTTGDRFSPTATLLSDGTVLIAGGDAGGFDRILTAITSAELFNPGTETFTATASMTSQRSQHTATLLTNGKVLLAGGAGDDSAELFDPATATFTAAGVMTQSRSQHTATLLNDGTVLVTGGSNDGRSTELYDPTTNKFMTASSMGTARFAHTATPLTNGQVLITGGQPASATNLTLNSAEVYK
jgi:Galactose oxidase, central domain